VGQVDATDDLNGSALVTFTAGGSFGLGDCCFHTVGYERERQALILFGSDAGRVMGDDENGDLEFVVAYLGVGVGHLERPAAHEDCTGLGDGVVHVRGVAERAKSG
jgi:hypothetical protein